METKLPYTLSARQVEKIEDALREGKKLEIIPVSHGEIKIMVVFRKTLVYN